MVVQQRYMVHSAPAALQMFLMPDAHARHDDLRYVRPRHSGAPGPLPYSRVRIVLVDVAAHLALEALVA
jgi:hypothetical protein